MKTISSPKKVFAFLTGLLLIAFALITTLTSCKNVVETDDDNTVKTITVFSWQDYIDEGYDDPTDEEEGTNPYFLEDVDLDDPYYAQYFGEENMTKSIVDIFMEENPDIVVNYRAFATNEEMYNELLKDPYGVDLICPSEYMIMKMRDEKLIIPYENQLIKAQSIRSIKALYGQYTPNQNALYTIIGRDTVNSFSSNWKNAF